MDTIQTKEGAVAISSENARTSLRSTRRAKTKNIATPGALASHLKINGKKISEGVAEIYRSIERESPTFFAFFAKENSEKNNFPDTVFLVDKTRVVLDEKPDYYHASYVDGVSQAKQYVLAQAPFDESTSNDFYRMVIQCKPEIMIVLMKLDDSNQYISVGEKEKTYGAISVKCCKSSTANNFGTYEMIISKTVGKDKKLEHKFTIVTFNNWTEDLKIPITEFRSFHQHVHKYLKGKPSECSQLVVCPNGADRSGVWTVFDTESERLNTKKLIRFSETVRVVRCQRFNTIEHFELFDGLINLLVEHAKTFK